MRFEATLWRYDGEAAWYFVTLPVEVADALTDGPASASAFGSVRVVATVGELEWRTSIFPDSKSGSYVLPVKKDVRARLGIDAGDTMRVDLRLAGA